MDVLVISLAALLASGLTLFSGFGLGTLLMPVVAVFLPLDVAVAVTALVHLANNAFKFALIGRHADPGVLLRFGLPAVAFAFAGAFLLAWLSDLPPVAAYTAFGRTMTVAPLKLIVGLLILVFVMIELSPAGAAVALGRRLLPLGGAISGFFGGLSGHQGAFRSMFLLKAGLDKEAFVATGVVLAVMVDLARLFVYGSDLAAAHATVDWQLVVAASLAAFAGAFVGSRLLKKVTIRAVQLAVSGLLMLVSLGLIAGAI